VANRVDATATAFSNRGALRERGWLDPAVIDVNIRWTRELAEVMRPLTTGSDYVNQIRLESDEGSECIRAAYRANYDRLVALKNKSDPTNLFRHNQNIKPTALGPRVRAAPQIRNDFVFGGGCETPSPRIRRWQGLAVIATRRGRH
jgi:hypothetical protein